MIRLRRNVHSLAPTAVCWLEVTTYQSHCCYPLTIFSHLPSKAMVGGVFFPFHFLSICFMRFFTMIFCVLLNAVAVVVFVVVECAWVQLFCCCRFSSAILPEWATSFRPIETYCCYVLRVMHCNAYIRHFMIFLVQIEGENEKWNENHCWICAFSFVFGGPLF